MSLPPDDRIIAARVSMAHEPSAVVMLQRVEEISTDFDFDVGRWPVEVRYEVPFIERIPGGSSPQLIADAVAELAAEATAERADRCSVLADVTTSGVPFMEALQGRRVRAAPVMIGDGALTRGDRQVWYLPVREMISIALAVLAEKRLAIAELPDAGKLVEQLEAYRTKAAPRDALADWRPAPHVDLAQALMAGLWWGERMLRPISRQPPAPRIPVRSPAGITFNQALQMARRGRLARRARARG